MTSPISFQIEAECPWSGARAGILKTPHGSIQTPVFMPCGTTGTLKGLTFDQVRNAGADIILGNSYHLFLRPGHELIEQAGGIHSFIGWQRPILTDSGGFQVFSLDAFRTIREDGVVFKDHWGGNKHFIGPERSMEIQNSIGADIIMAFDDCVKNPATHAEAKAAMDRTHRWLEKCAQSHKRHHEQALFGIVQGSIYEDLREASARAVTSVDLPGYAIGGVAVGEDRASIEKIVMFTSQFLPREKPRYLMGIGTPWDIAYAIRCGIDMFDCVSPTRLARHGATFIDEGRVSLRSSRFRHDSQPLDSRCPCYTCTHHSRAYLHHLMKLRETSGGSLLSIHNISYLTREARRYRKAVVEGKFQQYFEEAHERSVRQTSQIDDAENELAGTDSDGI